MYLNTLENLSTSEITKLFNDAFADYIIKIKLSTEFMQEKLDSEDVQLDKSVGIFKEGKPVAFILHAIRNNVAYNAGTGVLPEFRGEHATVKMYNHILPILKSVGASEVHLEVINENIPAIKSYTKVGFIKDRELPCFKGKVHYSITNTSITFTEIKDPNFGLLKSFWEWEPSWQSSIKTLVQLTDFKIYGAFLNDELVGYIFANETLGRVAQFAVKQEYRKQGIGTTLFHHFAELCTCEIGVFNTDGNHSDTHIFLQKIGLEHILTQHKMILKLNSK